MEAEVSRKCMCTHSGSEVLMRELFRSFLFQLVFYIYKIKPWGISSVG